MKDALAFFGLGIAGCLAIMLVTGCTHDQFVTYPQPYVMPQVHAAAAQATADCGGPWQSWSSEILTSRWPYSIERKETMRCMKDGRVVGPYTYREDNL